MIAMSKAKPQRLVVAFTAALGVAAVGAAVLDHVQFGGAAVDGAMVVPMLALLVAGGSFAIQFRFRDEIEALDLLEAVIAPVLFAFPGLAVVAMVAVANLVSERIHKNQPVKTAFNVAQWAAAAGGAALVLSALRSGPGLTWGHVGALGAALVVLLVVNHVSFSLVIALSQGGSLRQVFAALSGVIVPGWIIAGGLNVAFGFLFVAAYQWHPAVTVLFFVPLLALRWAQGAYAKARADEVRLRALHRASAVIGSAVDPFDTIDAFLEEMRCCFEAEAAELVLVDGDRRSVHRVPEGETPLAADLTTTLLSLTEPARVKAQTGQPDGWRDCLAAPLRDGSETIGVLCTYNRTGLEGFEDGELAVLAALASDVVAALQRWELVQRVVDERQKLRDIVDRASDGIFTIAVDGTVSSWNPAMEEITGHQAEGVLGRAELGLLRPRHADGRDVIFERWAEAGTAPPAELQVLTRAGERRWLSCSYSRVAGPEGSGDSLVVIARDVTKVRDVERLREDFVATVSHELRTPLAPIKGWASTLLQYGDRLDQDERQSAMQSILRQAQRLERLIVNLLEVSKIEHGVFEVPDADADVEVVVRRVVGDFQAASPGRHFDVCVRGPIWARAKELWLEQILTNLVSNAVKYSPETESVELNVCRRADRIQVSVTDNGYGIPTHDLERVFERFYRVRDTTTQTGTGLGLYIARQLAEEMDGTIAVESVLGRGSQFLLDLPAATRVVDVRSAPEVIGLEAS